MNSRHIDGTALGHSNEKADVQIMKVKSKTDIFLLINISYPPYI
jgi:hypothetical protein